MSSKKYTKKDADIRNKVLAMFKERGSEQRRLNIFVEKEDVYSKLIKILENAFTEEEVVGRLWTYDSRLNAKTIFELNYSAEPSNVYSHSFPLVIEICPKCIRTNDINMSDNERIKSLHLATRHYSQRFIPKDYAYGFVYGIEIALKCKSVSSESFLEYISEKNNQEFDVINYKKQLEN